MGSSKIVESIGPKGYDNPPVKANPEVAPFTCDCSSQLAHIITALVLAIITGVGVGAGTYFFTEHSIVFTAIAGVGGFTLAGLITYVAMRAYLGNPDAIKQ